MSTRLVILGLLKDRELYGYELKHIIEEHMGDWTSIAFGSIYFALGKMADEGLIEKSAVEKHSKRPSRSIYRITDPGRVEFEKLLHDQWGKQERQYFPFDIALFFMSSLPRDEAMGYLEKRLAGFETSVAFLKKHKTDTLADPQVPKRASAIMNHSLYHMEAEIAWLKNLLEQCRNGEL